MPFADFEEIFRSAQTAHDGQYKVQLLTTRGELELYVARQGRFNVEGYVGFDTLARGIEQITLRPTLNFSHAQVQTLLAGIGNLKGYDVYIPTSDVCKLQWVMTRTFALRETIPSGFDNVAHVLSEIDVVWVGKGRDSIESLFEVEHSTSIYSGLLRFNDNGVFI